MDEYSGFLFLVDEAQRAQQMKEYIERDGSFTDTMSAPDWKPKQVEIFLISLGEDAIHYAALAHRGRRVATQKYQIQFSNLVQFDPPISVTEIEQNLKPRVKSHFIRSSSGLGGHVPVSTWKDLIDVIKRLSPNNAQRLDELDNLRRLTPDYFKKPGFEIVAHERDAVNLALRVSGFDHRDFTEWSPVSENVIPFIKGLSSTILTEENMIDHDAQVFGDWDKIKRYQVGANLFEHGPETLTIINVNAQPIEHTLGVDLLYYFDKYKSYIMVQYKRMTRKDDDEKEFEYRPTGKTYRAELARMLSFERSLENSPQQVSPSEYRIHSGFFYFKLCPAEIFDPTATDMIHGMYLPLDYWRILMDSPSILGDKGGKRITYRNVERYFNNSMFIELVKAGWVGSQVAHVETITGVIKTALDSKRSVILGHFQST